MAYVLVVTNDIPQYPKGTILSDQVAIDRLRTSEYALQAVQVSDEVIPPPAPPPPPPDLTSIQTAVQGVAVKNQEQDAALAAANQVNQQQAAELSEQDVLIAQQNQTIAAQNATIADQNNKLAAQDTSLNAVVARVAALESGTVTPPPPDPNPSDDLPLAEGDGDVLTTNAGTKLVGDDRLD
jgi:uncharacterized coiled-coil protein SlyX